MKFTYLEKEKLYVIAALSLLFYWVLPFVQFLVWAALISLLIFIFRRNPYIGGADPEMRDGVFYSLCAGEVKRVERSVSHPFFGNGQTEIVIEKNGFSEFGLRLPTSCQVHDLKFESPQGVFGGFWGSLFTPVAKSQRLGGLFIKFKNDLGLTYGVHIPPGVFAGLAKLFVSIGDRGRLGALFGWHAFASRVLFYFPDDFTILVKPGQNLKSVESPVAGCPLLE